MIVGHKFGLGWYIGGGGDCKVRWWGGQGQGSCDGSLRISVSKFRPDEAGELRGGGRNIRKFYQRLCSCQDSSKKHAPVSCAAPFRRYCVFYDWWRPCYRLYAFCLQTITFHDGISCYCFYYQSRLYIISEGGSCWCIGITISRNLNGWSALSGLLGAIVFSISSS